MESGLGFRVTIVLWFDAIPCISWCKRLPTQRLCFRCCQRRRKSLSGLIDGFVREVKRSPVNAQSVLCAAVTSNRCGFFRIGVLRLHEISRSIRTDWDNSNQRWPEAEAYLTEDFSITVRGIPHAIDDSGRRFQDEAAP